MAWRDRLRPASFRGAPFKVDTTAKAGGRRGVTFEYPKRDTPSDEDLGRRAQRWAISGYVIGPFYTDDANELENALNAAGPGPLVHPTMGEMQVRCETYTRNERKDMGGFAAFEMTFVEGGQPATQMIAPWTQFDLRDQSDQAATALAQQSQINAKKLA